MIVQLYLILPFVSSMYVKSVHKVVSMTSILPTITPLPHTRPTLRVSLRNCCHRRHITLYAKSPYQAETVQSAQRPQTAPLSRLSRFTPFSVTSKPRTQRGTSRFKQCLALFCGLMERLLLWVRIGEYVSIPFIGFCDANNKLTL